MFLRRIGFGRAPGQFTLVTAADASHEQSLVRMLESVRANAPGTNTIVYDLGLSPATWDALAGLPVTRRRFQYECYPAFFDIRRNAGQYAWKPAIINEVMRERGGIVCWMDAGNLISDLSGLRRRIDRYGFYSPTSSGTAAQWTHRGMLHYLGMPETWGSDIRNLNGACIAVDSSCEAVRSVVEEWGRLAAIKECIAPPGSDRSNHRQDQALITVLAYRAGIAREEKAIGFTTHNDEEAPSSSGVSPL
jgi:hypothetical protein